MPHCRCKKGIATEFHTFPDGHKGFICKMCKEALEFKSLDKAARLQRLKDLEFELEMKEGGKKPSKK